MKRLTDRCEYEGCSKKAEYLAKGRDDRGGGHPKIGSYCELHAHMVEDEGRPEYTVSCPNCGCGFGVN